MTVAQTTAVANLQAALTTAVATVQQAMPTTLASRSAITTAQAAVASALALLPAVLAAFDSNTTQYIAGEQMQAALTVVNAILASVQRQSSVQLQGGSLFELAATRTGDISNAYQIMQANGIIAPWLFGGTLTDVSIPPIPSVFNDGSQTYNTGIVGVTR